VSLATAGDRDAMRELYMAHAAGVQACVLRIVGDRHDAEDVTQQVFAKLLTDLPRYRPGEAPFRAWVLRIAHNVAVDHLRRRRAVPCEAVREHDGGGDEAAAQARTSLRAALASLPPAQRDVLVLTHLVGLSPPEIAARMGCSVRSVHGLHYRGRAAACVALNNLGSAPATVPPIAPRRWPRRLEALSA
jgi:RNA polymerase sigma-70 factor, ECF subfamily